MSDINDLLNDSSASSNKDAFSISKLATRFKSLVLVLYVISVVIICLSIFAGIILISLNPGNGGAFFLVILGGAIALIVNEITFGLIATIIDIRDNVINIKN